MMCKSCWEDLTDPVYYVSGNEMKELVYCCKCLTYLLTENWKKYVKDLKSVDCEASLKRIIEVGPPQYFRDHMVEDNLEIKEFIYLDKPLSGRLVGALDDEACEALSKELKGLLEVDDYLSALQNIIDKLN